MRAIDLTRSRSMVEFLRFCEFVNRILRAKGILTDTDARWFQRARQILISREISVKESRERNLILRTFIRICSTWLREYQIRSVTVVAGKE